MVSAKTFLALAATALSANAAVISFFHNNDCTDMAGSRNVYDNTCATDLGFSYSSFLITTGPTDSNQQISAYSRDACAGATTGCLAGTTLNQCVPAYNGDGASNAVSSSPICGTV